MLINFSILINILAKEKAKKVTDTAPKKDQPKEEQPQEEPAKAQEDQSQTEAVVNNEDNQK